MDESSSQAQGLAAGAPPSVTVDAQSQLQSQQERGVGEGVEEGTTKEVEELLEKAQKLIDKITSSPDNPNPTVLHALSSLLEAQESLYELFLLRYIFTYYHLIVSHFIYLVQQGISLSRL